MKTLIKNGTIVNEGKTFRGNLVVDGEQITHIYNGEAARNLVQIIIESYIPAFISLKEHIMEKYENVLEAI